jgi:predicted HD phosphohydrolase
MSKQATFTEMAHGTAEDYAIIAEEGAKLATQLPDRILEHLDILKGETAGFAVDRYEHSLQTATRAYRDGKDEEYVDLAATMLQPFVSDENYWIVKHHGIFQGYYFFEYLGLDKNLRDEYKDNENWQACAEFCAKYDQNSFDPNYDSMSIEEFEPMVRRVFAQPRNSIYKKRDYA